MSRNSKIWNISHEDLQNIFDNSNSISEVLKKLDYKSFSANRHTLKKRLNYETFDLTKFENNCKFYQKNMIENLTKINKLNSENYLVENCIHPRNSVRRYILKNKIIEYKCKKCGNIGEWSGENLSLQLEHINGISNDNRLENLCFLCPNCHSQTKTWGGKNNIKLTYCKMCGKETKGYGEYCLKCGGNKIKKFDISKEELEKLLKEMSIENIGRNFNVTGNSIRKRCKKLGIEIPKYPRGYWIKK